MGRASRDCRLRQQTSSSMVRTSLKLGSPYGNQNAKLEHAKCMGLVDKLRTAATAMVVENLLQEGTTKMPDASPKTKRRWRYVATKRLKEIQAQSEKQTVVEKKAEKPEKTRKQRT